MPTVITIGNFDGVHLGHAALLARARGLAGSSAPDGEGGRVVAMTFDPHPASVLRPERTPPALAPVAARERQLRLMGADDVVRLNPADGVLNVSARDFVQSLVAHFGPAAFVEGPDFHFGKGREGNVRTLADLGREFGFRVEVVEPVEVALVDGSIVTASSTLARWLVGHGRVADAARVLGRPFELEGTVVQGDRKGRTIGFPTANLRLGPEWDGVGLPKDGVYTATAVLPGGAELPAMLNIGHRPTLAGVEHRIEAHVLTHARAEQPGAASEYGWPMTLRLTGWLRDQVRFPSFPALAAQLERDRRLARQPQCL